MKYLIIYIVFINVVAFCLYGIDKRKAIKHKWRISENTLLLFSILGGGLGSLLGMSVFHHKTHKLKFRLLVPIFTLFSIGILYYFFVYK